MKKVTPFVWFNNEAEAAADFYCSVFADAEKLSELRFSEAGTGPVGSLLVVDLEIEGQQITLMNGGPGHPLTDAFSLVVRCETQEEIDGYWAKLTEGGAEGRCGWLKDKFGLSWQIIPTELTTWLRKPAAMQAMMGMNKLEIAVLEEAAKA
jgi:predicted 3-demethylubiquinone-9 3-methyltransferase (glyoxalase superfamily)